MDEQIDITIHADTKKGIVDTVVEKIRDWSRGNSPWVIHYNSGSCNGCDIELLTLVTPRYDVERLGVKLQGSPRHADILIVTGAVTRQSKDRLIRIYNQMPEPKYVLALGSCGISGGVFHDCYCVEGGVNDVIPVDVYVPGCPPRPEAMINGVATLLAKMKEDKTIKKTGGPTIFAQSVSPEPTIVVDDPNPAKGSVEEKIGGQNS
jgi:NADH-quinone oxidoreductase B subunit